jgi:hypothetical protein
MKKVKLLFALCSVAALFAVLAFVNNLAAIWNWWSAFLAAGGDSAAVAAHAPGLFAWLDWSAVDYSAVSTFVPMLGLICMTSALARILRGRSVRIADFPFFKGSDQLNIALGLFGTLWGIIVIGYFKLDTVQMADLMQCLHTALFSTLVAVVWVFLLDRPLIRPFFVKLLEECGNAEVEDGDLAAAVDRLVTRLVAASDAFEKRQGEFEAAFAKRLSEFETEQVKRSAEYFSAFEKRSAAFADEFEKRSAAYAAEFEKRMNRYAAAFEDRAEKCSSQFERQRREYAAHYEKRLLDYEEEFEKRQKEYVEFFRRRIDELEKRAEESDSRLKAVAAALKV